MRAARILTYVGIVLGSALLGIGFAIDDAVRWIAPAAATALLWLVGEWRGWGWATMAGFVLLVGLAATGMLMGHSAVWMGITVMVGVCAWSLGDFTRRVSLLAREKDHSPLLRRFLSRLLFLAGVSVALGAIALTIHIRLTFLLAILLGILVIYGLSRVIGAWRSVGY